MEHRRPDDRAPGPGDDPAPGAGGGLTADERARAAGTADPGVAGDTHVAGPAPKPPVMDAPGPGTPPPAAPAERPPAPAGAPARLLDAAEAERFRARWREVQSAFVDDPGESVRRADDLASDAVDALGRAIAEHRRTLSEGALKREGADTERLRLALRGYRDLLNRVIDA